ncbi:MAG: chitobiase/beta-hexosaminidase C-terminal domain-containing protein, partial [Muribaculaceae bacterium]|nr:chitobiase/beta-hexosaminidase C-terminal domain-containing protein [Muribaculaceae bacterium]
SYTVNIGGAFTDGTRVMDCYNTETTATVTGGKVTMTASGPVLLIEEYGTISNDPIPPIPPRPSKPTVSANPGSSEFTDNVTVSLSVNPAGVPIHYSTTGTASASSPIYSSPLTFNQTTTLSTYVENEAGSNAQSFTYTKKSVIIDPVEPEDEYYIYFDDMSKQDVAVWAWGEGNINCTASGEWPGDMMTQKNGKYYWSLPAGKSVPTQVIISWGSHNSDGEKAGGGDLAFVNKHTYKADGSHSLVTYGPQKPTISVSPAEGKVKGSSTIVVTIGNGATLITGTFNGKSLALSNGSNNISVAGYLNEGESGNMSITASNSVGSTTLNTSFTRDDTTPVVSLTGDWRELSIYQIMVASFQHGEGGASGYSDMWGPNGHRKNGNLRGIINSLDYIKDLGMNAIWMTPIFDSTNGQGGEKLQATGYFCTNYFKVDPKFGSEAEFDELIREAHARGIYVILDGVFGHHGGVTAASPNGKTIQTQANTPNVRGSEAGNIVFPGSLEYFKEVIRYWMERGVDGWRLDQCYQAYQGGHNYWKELRAEAEKVAAERKARGEQWGILAYMVGEDWTNADKITTTQQDGLKSVMDFDAMYTFEYMNDMATAGYFLSRTPSDRGYKDSGVYPTFFLSNHDTDRVGDFSDVNTEPKKLMARHAAVAAYSGPTCTYYGDEIGDKSGKATNNGNADNWARTSGRISGFNANEQMVHDYVAKVFKARSENPALWRGTAERRTQGNVEIITKTDSQTGNKVIVIFSPSDASVSIGGSGIDLINGGNVSGNVSVSAWVPAFIKMN